MVVLRATVPIRTTTPTGLPLSHTRQFKSLLKNKPSQDSLAPGKALKLRPRNQASCRQNFFFPTIMVDPAHLKKMGVRVKKAKLRGVGCGSDLLTKNIGAKPRSLVSVPRTGRSLKTLLASARHGETQSRDV